LTFTKIKYTTRIIIIILLTWRWNDRQLRFVANWFITIFTPHIYQATSKRDKCQTVFFFYIVLRGMCQKSSGPGWLNEVGSWIT
jgi:hypothetical protein